MPTKYQPLVDHVVAQTTEAVTLSFTDIEAIIGFPLSISSQVTQTVWTNTRRTYVVGWRAMGWRARLDRRNRCVRFTRDAEG